MSSLPYPLSATSSAANSPTYLIPNNQNFYPSSNAPPHTGLSAPLEPSPASTLSSTPTNTYGIAPDGLNVDNNFDFGEFAGDGLDLPPIPLSQQPTYSQYAPNYNLSLSIPHGTTDYGGTPSPPGLARSMNTSASSSVASTPAPHHSRDTQSPRPRSWPPSSSIPVQPSPVLSPDPIEPYFNTISERNLVGSNPASRYKHSSPLSSFSSSSYPQVQYRGRSQNSFESMHYASNSANSDSYIFH
jgi:hypothetical protein